MKKIIAFALAVTCTLGFKANAQNVISACPVPADPLSCMARWSWDDFPAKLPMGTYCCTPPGGFAFNTFCETKTKSCGASSMANASCRCDSSTAPKACPCQSGSPIDVASGNTYITQTDISIPGLGGGLHLSRTWNSILEPEQGTFVGMFGGHWRSTYEQRLVFNSPDNYPKFAEADGSIWAFAYTGTASSGYYLYKSVAPATDNSTTLTDGPANFTLTYQNGEQRAFDLNTGLLQSITDRNGNVTQLTYDASNRLTTVIDPAARHIYFNYSGSSTLVSTVTTDFGVTLSYTYDGQGNLIKVTKPDQTTISFLYDSNSRITSVLDTNGKLLETHTYDAKGRGLTSSRANGVDAVTLSYQQ